MLTASSSKPHRNYKLVVAGFIVALIAGALVWLGPFSKYATPPPARQEASDALNRTEPPWEKDTLPLRRQDPIQTVDLRDKPPPVKPVEMTPSTQFAPATQFDPAKGRVVTDKSIQARKTTMGVDEGIDMIVRADESFVVGDTTLSMAEIAKQILEKKNLLEKKPNQTLGPGLSQDLSHEDIIEIKPKQEHRSPPKTEIYGIYIVKPGDNIWNIHFKFLKGYFKNKGMAISSKADEPNENGLSSGVGRLLKFSEKMVYIYNIEKRRLDLDLHLLKPDSKIVVYNMAQVFSLLNRIRPDDLDRIQYDGDRLVYPNLP